MAYHTDQIASSMMSMGMQEDNALIKDAPPISLPSTAAIPVKTDKPRPHVCTTCMRAFARLEHLKRHERSHTKEKPFACNECPRCFARRDLLLRHQQKLHLSVPAPRARRRESASSVAASGTAKVRKGSAVQNGAPQPPMRPRAKTMSHVDGSSAAMAAPHMAFRQQIQQHQQFQQQGLPASISLGSQFGDAFRIDPVSSFANHHLNSLPRLETSMQYTDVMPPLHTAPVNSFGAIHAPYMSGSTIDPAQLQRPDPASAISFDHFDAALEHSRYSPVFLDDEAWLSPVDGGIPLFENDFAIDNSLSSIDGNGSPLLDNLTPEAGPANAIGLSASLPADVLMIDPSMISTSTRSINTTSITASNDQSFRHKQILRNENENKPYVSSSYISESPFTSATFDDSTNSATSVTSSNPYNGLMPSPADTITRATRQSLLTSLAEAAVHSQLKTAQPRINPQTTCMEDSQLPATTNLQRYVAAYIQCFHPHIPFLHISTLNFSMSPFTNFESTANNGGSALLLGICAIGALYEHDSWSKKLHEQSKLMIQMYLQDQQMLASQSGAPENSSVTPLWLVQAMLLNVIYGHNSGDQTAANIATTHGAALISLAKSAGLLRPPSLESYNVEGLDFGNTFSITNMASTDDREWQAWRLMEERKRTLYAIFNMSSLLVSAYNSSPPLMNAEVALTLPCNEKLWSASNAEIWKSFGGCITMDLHNPSFSTTLTSLLSASSRQSGSGGMSRDILTDVHGSVSSFGCLVLINAIHNCIWEMRQGQRDIWSPAPNENLHGQFEATLRAWQALWSSQPDHSLERPNPYGSSSLSADCIPLLDLAYVRLSADLSLTKEQFFQREYEQMAVQLAKIFNEGDEVHDPEEREASDSKRQTLRQAAFCAANSLKMSTQLNVTFADFNSRELPLQSALCAFDCAQILAEWTFSMHDGSTQNPEEILLAEKVKDVVQQLEAKLSRRVDALEQTQTRLAEIKVHGDDHGKGYASINRGEKSLSEQVLDVHARMLELDAIWPLCLEMAQALRAQALHIRRRIEGYRS